MHVEQRDQEIHFEVHPRHPALPANFSQKDERKPGAHSTTKLFIAVKKIVLTIRVPWNRILDRAHRTRTGPRLDFGYKSKFQHNM